MGLYKNIGNGKSTFVWRDPWIPGVHAGRLNPLNDVVVSYVRLVIYLMKSGECNKPIDGRKGEANGTFCEVLQQASHERVL
ncbi:uncharacterized protein G2W53_021605 [Senna tora]|uniref:Uncharacterized protein n=1 Tax=Senna tora TaxID=362788 RepID=A0A834WL97_9FABA|nr:uncharacterized protein G2W53_021605 [Senna tora]